MERSGVGIIYGSFMKNHLKDELDSLWPDGLEKRS